MKKFFKHNVLIAVLILGGTFFSAQVEAKDATWTDNLPSLVYRWNCGGGGCNQGAAGWSQGLSSPVAQIQYHANVYDNATNTLISDNATVPLGTVLRLVPTSAVASDIFWSGTGQSQDSPYGVWTNGATPPAACNSNYFTNNANDDIGNGYAVYTPLSVNSVTPQVSVAGSTAALTSVGTNLYRVDGPGLISARFVYPQTYGKFYYSYKLVSKSYSSLSLNQCMSNNVPMRDYTFTYEFNLCIFGPCPSTNACTDGDARCSTINNKSDYQMQVPEQQIIFNFNAVGANQPPNPPTITGPTTGSPNVSSTFNFQATDPDNNTIRYGVDWDNNNTVDQWLPGAGYVASNTIQGNPYSWATPGTYNFQALTQDSNGASSGWTGYQIRIIGSVCNANQRALCSTIDSVRPQTFFANNCSSTQPGPMNCAGGGGYYGYCELNPACSNAPAPTANLQINGSDGPLSVPQGSTLTITWTSSNATSCTAYGAGWGSGNAVALTGSSTTNANQGDTYILSCTDGTQTTVDQVVVSLQSTLKICQNSCSSGVLRGSASITGSFTLAKGGTQNLVACFNPASGCTDSSGDVTGSANWSEGGNSTISLSGNNPKTVTGDNAGSENVSASYSGQTANTGVTVTCVPTVSCANAPGAGNYCENENFNVDNGCGVSISCNGTKTCNYNWKEVAP